MDATTAKRKRPATDIAGEEPSSPAVATVVEEVSDAEVEEFYAILRRMRDASRRLCGAGARPPARAPAWRPSFSWEDFCPRAGDAAAAARRRRERGRPDDDADATTRRLRGPGSTSTSSQRARRPFIHAGHSAVGPRPGLARAVVEATATRGRTSAHASSSRLVRWQRSPVHGVRAPY
ncbi:hypothetical protein PR202_ga23606 [Eleusine coracana subsp. coracana]|uniref:Uncharacterized protein n=1 Tax=Eleusine coracana subsp. coracana TaxID=191504 RepID=A0AAV5D6N7_ELECO|nr:hypothetical protein PR202_ga23606 [Eleusine coracana subsp. coracana]